MKHLLTLLLSVFVFEAAIQAQAPQLLNYQGVARNGFGNALPNRQMTLRLSIRNGSSSGTVVYSETRTVTTNGGGLYSVQIGSTGTSATTGSLATINWQVGTKFLQVEVDPDAGTNFVDLGTTQLVSVPYAMSAGVATPGGSAGGDLSGTYPNPSVANSAINTIKLADAAVTTLKLADQSVTTSKLADYSVTSAKLADLSVTTGKLVDASVTTAKIADANVTTAKLADASVTDAKIVTVAGSKVTGNISGNAANVTGTVAVANGGTGATTAAAARTNLGLGNVDNTSDLNKPISTATQAALDLKENLSNKSTVTTLGTSDVLYPTQNAVKSYVDGQIVASSTPDATTTVKGKVQLAGDLTGTAASPAVAAAAITTAKLADASVTDAKIVTVSGSKVTGNIAGSAANVTGTVAVANGGTGATTAAAARTNLGLGNVDNTSDLNKPISTATQAALDLKENLSNKSTATALGTSDVLYPTQNAVKSYVDGQIVASSTPDATTTVKGKVQLAGDLTGTAESPSVAAGAITTTKLADASVTDAKIVTVSGSKVTGNISGNAGTVTNGVYTVGDQTIAGVKTFSSTIVGSVSGNASTVTTNANLTGPVTSVGNATAIANGTITNAMLANSAVANLSGTNTGDQTTITGNAGTVTNGVYTVGDQTIAGVKTFSSTIVGSVSGNAANVTGTVAVANGGTGATTAAGARTNLGGTTVGGNFFTLSNPSAITFPRINANNTIDALSASDFRTAIGAASSSTSGTVTSVAALTLGTTGTDLSSSVANGSTTPVITLNVPDASVNARGVITTGTQTFAGAKTFSSDITVNGVKIGRGAGNNDQNVAVGADALASGTGARNTAIGYGAMRQYSGTSFDNNTSVGYFNMPSLTTGNGNTSVGAEAMLSITTGTQNTSIGNQALINTTGNNNVGVGKSAGQTITTGSQNTILGTDADVAANNLSNATALGYGATVAASNRVQLGNTDVTNVKTSGTLTAGAITYPNTDGTSNQVLTTNGSGTLTWRTPSTTATAFSGVLPIANGGTGSSTQNFVDLSNNQTISGYKSFSTNINANDIQIGKPSAGSQNTMLGEAVFAYGTPGSNNTALGFMTLTSLQGGDDNTAVGTNAIRQGGAANGSRNTAVGSSALSNGGASNDNVAIGSYAMPASVTGSSNVALGSSALYSNTSASYNVGVGFEALKNTTTGGNNTAIGRGAMLSNTSGDVNTAVGENALVSNTSGRYNTSIGVQAQEQNTTGGQNTAIGVAAIDRNISGSNNAVLGAFAGRHFGANYAFLSDITTNISNSVLIGYDARPLANNSSNEIVIGYNAVGNGSNTAQIGNSSITNVKTSGTLTAGSITYPNTAGTNGYYLKTDGSGTASWAAVSSGATSVGAIAGSSTAYGASITSGVLNLSPADGTNGGVVTTSAQTFAGAKTFSSDLIVNGITVGKGLNSRINNTAIGLSTLAANTSGTYNTATGNYALTSNTSGEGNTAIGSSALGSNTTGAYNTATGYNAMSSNSTGQLNTAYGMYSVRSNTTGNNNTGTGYDALYANTSGNNNTAAGSSALSLNTTGNYNIAYGSEAGRFLANGSTYNTTSDYSVYLGSNTKASADNAQNEIVIGYNAVGNGSNTAQIGNSSITNVKTSGTLTAGAVTYPNTDGTANQVLTTNGSGVASWSTPTTAVTTIGSIAGSSTANGASISGATLTLAPADGTNGGIVTNGAQTFAGNKTIKGSLNTQFFPGTEAIDINANNPTSPVQAPDNDARQSFTAGSSGYLTGIKVTMASTGTYTLTLYQGGNLMSENSPGGTQLFQTTFTSTNYVMSTIPITNISISSGTTYWLRITGGSLSMLLNWGQSNVGTTVSFPSYHGGLTYSWIFQTLVSPIEGGNITAQGSVTAGQFITTSDIRLKSNIKPLNEALSIINQLKPVQYDKRNSLESNDYSKKENGFIAQEIKNVIPFIVKEGSGSEKILSVDYISLIPLLTAAIQEQQKLIELQQEKLKELEKIIKKSN